MCLGRVEIILLEAGLAPPSAAAGRPLAANPTPKVVFSPPKSGYFSSQNRVSGTKIPAAAHSGYGWVLAQPITAKKGRNTEGCGNFGMISGDAEILLPMGWDFSIPDSGGDSRRSTLPH